MNSTLEHSLRTAIERHLAGDIAAAFELYNDILSADPQNVTALVNQSAIFIDLGRPKDAADLLERAVILVPEDIEALNNYGNALQKLGQSDAAIEQFKNALSLAPANAAIASNLGRALLRQGDYAAAIGVLEAAIDQNPENTALKFINALALPVIPESQEKLITARERLAVKVQDLLTENLKLTDPLNEIGMTNFHAAYHGKDDRQIQENLAKAYLTAYPDLNFTAPHIAQARAPGKIKIGFVSTHLGSHTIGKLNRALIMGLNKDKFEVFIFCPGSDMRGQDDFLDEIASSADHIYFPAPSLTNTRAVIAEAGLDILYYPDIGMEPLSYFLSFSRLAPVQCVTWGHPVTTGVSTIDFFISSALTEPVGAQDHYTEKLVCLESFSTDFQMPELPQAKKSRADFGLNENANLYICPQSLFKFHPDFDDILGNILRQDGDGEIVLLEGQNPEWAVKLRRRFETKNSDITERINFIPRLTGADYHQLIALADVILDTPIFCGGNTSYEAFALSKIVVTLPSDFVRGRLTLGLYRQMGIDVAIAETPEDYINLAVKFGCNAETRHVVEKDIHQAHSSLFYENSALRAHETFFLEALNIDSH
jgi:protein O-GlcNAc transferase